VSRRSVTRPFILNRTAPAEMLLQLFHESNNVAALRGLRHRRDLGDVDQHIDVGTRRMFGHNLVHPCDAIGQGRDAASDDVKEATGGIEGNLKR